jgi:hypothetical protein
VLVRREQIVATLIGCAMSFPLLLQSDIGLKPISVVINDDTGKIVTAHPQHSTLVVKRLSLLLPLRYTNIEHFSELDSEAVPTVCEIIKRAPSIRCILIDGKRRKISYLL